MGVVKSRILLGQLASGGCLAHLRGTNKTCIDLTRGWRGGGGRKITRLLPIHCSGTSHVHYLNVWNKMAITQSCCPVIFSWLWCSFISKCSRNDVKTNEMFKLREKTFLNCFQLGFGKRLIYWLFEIKYWQARHDWKARDNGPGGTIFEQQVFPLFLLVADFGHFCRQGQQIQHG